jgi:hypothetical protein
LLCSLPLLFAVGAVVYESWDKASCYESKWDEAKSFESVAWLEPKNLRRESFYHILRRDLPGMDVNRVREKLGSPWGEMGNGNDRTLAYQIAPLSIVTCGLVAVMVVHFDESNVVKNVSWYRRGLF